MPIYERECKNCEYFQEAKEKMSAARTISCPECGEKKLRKIISKVNFQIRGASSKNDYFTPPKNEELGLPPENVLMKRLESDFAHEQIQLNRELTVQEKEKVTEKKRKEAHQKYQKDKRINELRQKNPEFSRSLDKAMKGAKGKTKKQRKQDHKKREKAGIKQLKLKSERLKPDL